MILMEAAFVPMPILMGQTFFDDSNGEGQMRYMHETCRSLAAPANFAGWIMQSGVWQV